MLYLPRLFVYHSETSQIGDSRDQIFQVMEEKLMRIIMQPAMFTTWVAGLLLLLTPGIAQWDSYWLWIKLAAVILMTATHFWLRSKVQEFSRGDRKLSGKKYRYINELPTFLMIVIVISVVVKPL